MKLLSGEQQRGGRRLFGWDREKDERLNGKERRREEEVKCRLFSLFLLHAYLRSPNRSLSWNTKLGIFSSCMNERFGRSSEE